MIEPGTWGELAASHPPPLVAELRRLAEQGGPFRVTPTELAAPTSATSKQALALLRAPALARWLHEETQFRCPHGGEELSREEAGESVCPYHPEIDFAEHPILEATFFVHDAPPTRDVRWLLALHGMNTRGWWQEDLNWLVSLSYGRMVPVAIYKYGLVRPGAVIRLRQRRIMRKLILRIERLAGETESSGFGSRPDVIAHSFGTWLLGHGLVSDPGLRVGRVILLGSILRPDHDWSRLIQRGQVEAVLNHHGTEDGWVRIAQRFIPCSGPSGRRGFDDPAALNRPAPGFGHSQFFEEDVLPTLFREVWGPFLTAPSQSLSHLPELSRTTARWRPGRMRGTAISARCTLEPGESCRKGAEHPSSSSTGPGPQRRDRPEG